MCDRDVGLNTNVPALLTRFIGREKLVDDVQRLVTRGYFDKAMETPRRVARRQSSSRSIRRRLHGAASAFTDATLVATTIAQTLGVNIVGKWPPLDALKRYLRDRNLLLVLDNFEKSVRHAAASQRPIISRREQY